MREKKFVPGCIGVEVSIEKKGPSIGTNISVHLRDLTVFGSSCRCCGRFWFVVPACIGLALMRESWKTSPFPD